MLASELYAISQGAYCEGPDECHWCGAPCKRMFSHDDVIPIPYVRNHQARMLAKRPGNGFVCVGCWLWRGGKKTIRFLDNTYKDGGKPPKFSWYATEQGAWAVRTQNEPALWQKLLEPPLRFMLSFLIGEPIASGELQCPNGVPNHLQLCVANDHAEIKADTPLSYTVNNVLHTYTVYELGEAIRRGLEGKSGGVRALFTLLGPPPVGLLGDDDPQKVRMGRYPIVSENDGKMVKKVVTPASGAPNNSLAIGQLKRKTTGR